MILYLSVIVAAMLMISTLGTLSGLLPWHGAAVAVILCTGAQFALDGGIALIINRLPDRLFSVSSPVYRVSETEKRLYKRLKVRLWKDKVWELGGLGGFSKRVLADPTSPEYIEKFIIECNKGVLTHRLSYPIGFVPMLFLPREYAVLIALPVALVNLFLNILPTLVLRYNTPKLQAMLQRMRRSSRTSS